MRRIQQAHKIIYVKEFSRQAKGVIAKAISFHAE